MVYGYKQSFGRYGETFACEYLKKKHYKILEKNYRNKFGETDIIARKKKTTVFIEVKTRFSEKYGRASEAVNYYKQKRLINSAKAYLAENDLLDSEARFDIIEVYGSLLDGKFECEEINHIENALEDA